MKDEQLGKYNSKKDDKKLHSSLQWDMAEK